RFDVFRIDSVVADHGRGHHHDLAEVGGVGEDLLVPAQIGGEYDFCVRRLERQRRGSGEPGAVLEEDVSGRWARAGDWAVAVAAEAAEAAPSVESRSGAASAAPASA